MMYVHRHENIVFFSFELRHCLRAGLSMFSVSRVLRLDDGVGQEGAWRLTWLVLNPFPRR
ncbi:unnamed protein product [Penicillium salamii]|uniref:Uncharacterized protein n=1 Tax=Penicillium salamii TaxID=1612424 RepID=A0A9W4JC44_9EURO|nr:unnamed protein product [Penicillium salamii]CAG8360633.1 unnamed protein product [Penicillium salamii]CAG8388909.1 unnamed protein product [Penicillium salamii]